MSSGKAPSTRAKTRRSAIRRSGSTASGGGRAPGSRAGGGVGGRARRLLAEPEAFKAQRNDASKQIGAAIQKGAAADGPEVAGLKRTSTEAGEKIKQLDAGLAEIEADLDQLL